MLNPPHLSWINFDTVFVFHQPSKQSRRRKNGVEIQPHTKQVDHFCMRLSFLVLFMVCSRILRQLIDARLHLLWPSDVDANLLELFFGIFGAFDVLLPASAASQSPSRGPPRVGSGGGGGVRFNRGGVLMLRFWCQDGPGVSIIHTKSRHSHRDTYQSLFRVSKCQKKYSQGWSSSL